MKKLAVTILLTASLLTVTACTSSPPPAEPVETPSQVEPSPTESLSKPHGTWTLSEGLPDGWPEHVPLPEDRWNEEKTTDIDETGGMTHLWVEAQEVDAIISELEAAGWNFTEPDGSGGTRIYSAYTADMSESLYFGFQPEKHDQDAELTVTWTTGLGANA